MQKAMQVRPLDLGPMTGDWEYITARVDSLIRTFSGFFDMPDGIKVVYYQGGGKTDCETTIWLTDQDKETYIVAEHELSHWLGETDLDLTQDFVKMAVSRLLNRAGLKPGTTDALAFEEFMKVVVHQIWNILEDYRCLSVWGELYEGGARLLRQRWYNHLSNEGPGPSEKNLVRYLCRRAAGIATPTAPAEFQACNDAMQRAMNLIEGVDAVACLGITNRLIDEVIDELIDFWEPPPPPQKAPAGGGGKSKQGQPQKGGQKSKAKQPKKGKSRPKKGPKQSPKQRQQAKKQKALNGLKALSKAVPRRGKHSLKKPEEQKAGHAGPGSPDVQSTGKRKKRNRAGTMAKVKRILTAGYDRNGQELMEEVLQDGARKMNKRIEAARAALKANSDDENQAKVNVVTGWAEAVGIPVKFVTPDKDLPPHTATGEINRNILRRLRMKKRRKLGPHGDVNTDVFLDMLGRGQLDPDFYDVLKKSVEFELLFLVDVSGSMNEPQLQNLVSRALADSIYAVKALRCKATVWGFSQELYVFTRPGMPKAPGVVMGMTHSVQALEAAKKWALQAKSKRAVLMVTDGVPTTIRKNSSTGNAIDDMRQVLEEMRSSKVPTSVIAIQPTGLSKAQAEKMYNRAFGPGRYGLIRVASDLTTALPDATRILASGRIK